MKFSTILALGLAHGSMARKVRNSYPPARRDMSLNARDGSSDERDFTVSIFDNDNGDSKGNDNDKGNGGNGGQDFGNFRGGGRGGNDKQQAQTQIIIIWNNPGGGQPTTTVNEKVTVTQTVTAAPDGAAATPPAAAASHTVTVGGPSGLVYSPESLEGVPVGDMVIFEFLAQNHTVTQSGFAEPCVAMAGGMDTGHQPNPDNTVQPPPQVAMQVTTSDPLWFYCKTGNHCGSGMVFSINPTKKKSQAAFKQAAIAQNGTGAAAPIAGGGGAGATPSAVVPPAATPSATAPAAGGDQGQGSGGDGAGADQGQGTGGGEGVVPGQGTVGQDGSCTCVVSCSAGGFPAAAQGLGAVGGNAGSLPVRMIGLS